MDADREQRIKLLAVSEGGPLAPVVDQLLAELASTTPVLMEAVRADRDLYASQNEFLRGQLEEHKVLVAALKSELDGNQPTLASASRSIIELSDKAQTFEHEATYARAERTAVKMELDKVNAQYESARDEIARLNALVRTLTEDRLYLRAKLEGYEPTKRPTRKG